MKAMSLLLTTALGLNVLLGCASLSGHNEYLKAGMALQREIDDRVANLTFLRGGELIQNLRRLIWIGEPAIPALLGALDHDDPKTRGSVAYVLGEIRDPRVVKILRKSLDDDAPEVRYEVAASLIAIGDWDSLPVLFDGLKDGSVSNRKKCIEVLQLKVGQNFDFDPNGPVDERQAAVQRWHEWWSASREGDLL